MRILEFYVFQSGLVMLMSFGHFLKYQKVLNSPPYPFFGITIYIDIYMISYIIYIYLIRSIYISYIVLYTQFYIMYV